MTPLRAIERELRGLGYRSEAIFHDYSFADVLSSTGEERRVSLAVFTQVPESYRSAAFGVITGEDDAMAIAGRRALGAPILFSIGQRDIGVWRVGAEGVPRLLERVALDAIPDLFRRNAERWQPQAVHRAKSLGQGHTAYQLDFVDLGLLPAIEHEVEAKLDKLLHRVIEQLLTGLDRDREEEVFRTTFRLLAAKILLDREHPIASAWRDAPVSKILDGIEAYYNFGQLSLYTAGSLPKKSVAGAWALLRAAISFRNISSDSLAFVYENTLVTADTRKRFGTHSTPRPLAEYVVSRLDFGNLDLDELTIYEPFTGAGTFLVAALRRLRDLLPDNLTGKKRHAFLVPRIRGAEIDSFACEVATLSLILADYPNANGWKIKSADLFRPAALAQDAASAKVILCNPPWEDFDASERAEYPEMIAKSFSKPMAVLHTILDVQPEAIGFVLPQGILRQKQYAELRQRVADLYGRVDLTSVPDRVFQRAGFEAAVLVASERRKESDASTTKILSAVIEDRDRVAFLQAGKITAERRRSKVVTQGDLWIGALDELWEHLARNPQLGAVADVHRGLQWHRQREGVSDRPRGGYKRGVFRPSDSLVQFGVTRTVYLDVNPEAAYRQGPLARDWTSPKILTNVARLTRGPWRIAAAFDTSGLIASQAFFGIWLKDSSIPPEAIEAIFNSPLASAFLAESSSNQHFTNHQLMKLPLPKRSNFTELAKRARRYRDALAAVTAQTLRSVDADSMLNRLLIEVDAEVLKAYDLPPRIERRLLEFFRGFENQRPVRHEFDSWLPVDFTAFIPLHEYLGPLVEDNRGPWALDVFAPAPDAEVVQISRYVR